MEFGITTGGESCSGGSWCVWDVEAVGVEVSGLCHADIIARRVCMSVGVNVRDRRGTERKQVSEAAIVVVVVVVDGEI